VVARQSDLLALAVMAALMLLSPLVYDLGAALAR
jgi:hypothetical protein